MMGIWVKRHILLRSRNKFSLGFLMLNLIAVGALGAYVISSLSSFTKRQIDDSVLVSSGQLSVNIASQLNEYVKISNIYYNDTYFQSMLNDKSLTNFDILIFYQHYIFPNIGRYRSSYDANLRIYAANPQFLKGGGGIITGLEDIWDTSDCQSLYEQPNRIYWSSVYEDGGRQSFSMYRLLNVADSLNPAGVLRLEIPEANLSGLFVRDEDRLILVMNPSGAIVTSSDRSMIGMNIANTGRKRKGRHDAVCAFKTVSIQCQPKRRSFYLKGRNRAYPGLFGNL